MADPAPNDASTVGKPPLALSYPAAGHLLQALSPDSTASEGGIPGYIIDRPLGGGGGGRVFRAFRDGSDQPIALKILNTPLGSGPASARVWREVDLLASLRLPAVARLVDHGTHDGRLFFAAEFVDGGSLADFVASLHAGAPTHPLAASLAPLDPRPRLFALVDLLARLADAVQSIHERGVLHRDLKPANVIITPQGDPVLVDFGLATLADHHLHTITADGLALGTPAFMPPEQARGDRAAISTRSDVWSLGATACWVLTGHTPFDTDCSQHEALRRAGHDQPRNPRALCADLPRPLAAVIAKATARDPAARYPTAAEFAADLRRFTRGEPVSAVEPSAWLRMARWIGRHPILATTAACVTLAALTLSAMLALIAWGWSRPAIVRRDSDSQSISILSGFGRPIRTWDTRQRNGIANHLLATRSDGVHLLVVAAQHQLAGSSDFGNDLHVFDFGRGGVPLWSSADPARRLAMPPKPNTTANNQYNARQVRLVDVFSQPLGPELLAIHTNQTNSGSCIRVYSLFGEVLSEVWHDGQMSDIQWMPDHSPSADGQALGVAIALGVNSERTYAQLGLDHPVRPAANPPVAFALRPPQDVHGWLVTPTDPLPDMPDTVKPEWYLYLRPPEAASQVEHLSAHFYALSDDGTQCRAAYRARLDTQTRLSDLGLFWTFDRHGPVGPARAGNTYPTTGFVTIDQWHWADRPE
jgi:serine/threonine protein kinase